MRYLLSAVATAVLLLGGATAVSADEPDLKGKGVVVDEAAKAKG